jgi:hypothetical protein
VRRTMRPRIAWNQCGAASSKPGILDVEALSEASMKGMTNPEKGKTALQVSLLLKFGFCEMCFRKDGRAAFSCADARTVSFPARRGCIRDRCSADKVRMPCMRKTCCSAMRGIATCHMSIFLDRDKIRHVAEVYGGKAQGYRCP